MLKAGDISVDLILAEVELPHGKGAGMKMLKLIAREEQLKQIPVVSKSLSTQGLVISLRSRQPGALLTLQFSDTLFFFLVVMSTRDEMVIVARCLRLGAADFLVKPLRTNELLNLWTHMWRRRRSVSQQT